MNPHRRTKSAVAAMLLLAGVACFADASSEQVVRSYVAAYNAHSIDEMFVHLHDDIRWMSVDGDAISTEALGKADLRVALRDYFDAYPSARSVLRDVQSTGSYVTSIEEARWVADGETHSQCAAAVYRLEGDAIRSVWYFAAQPCD